MRALRSRNLSRMALAPIRYAIKGMPARAIVGALSGALSLTVVDSSVAQTAASFGSASPSIVGLKTTPQLHAGVFCVDYSGLEARPSRLSRYRSLDYPAPIDATSITASEWSEILDEYDTFEKELGQSDILSSDPATAHEKLLKMSLADLTPQITADPDDFGGHIERLTKKDALTQLNSEYMKQLESNPEKGRLAKDSVAPSLGVTPDQISDAYLATAAISTQFANIYQYVAFESDVIPVDVASRLVSRATYLENVKTWKMSPAQLRGQVLAELSYAHFREGNFLEAQKASYASLKALGSTPVFYTVTDWDDKGHRQIEFSRNLAFLVAKLSDYVLAEQAQDAASAFQSSLDLASYSDELDHMLWYYFKDTKTQRWHTGSRVYDRMLRHFATNIPIVADPKAPQTPGENLNKQINAFWWDSADSTLYVVLSKKDGDGASRVTIAIAGGSGGWWHPPSTGNPTAPPPPQGPRFGDGNGPRFTARLVGGPIARDQLARHLRREIDQHSTDDVALFTVLKEGNAYRVFFPTSRIAKLPTEIRKDFGEFETFVVQAKEIDNLQGLSVTHPLKALLGELGAAALTMYAAPHTILSGEFQKDADDFAFRLAAAFRDDPVFRDYFTSDTISRSNEMRTRLFGIPAQYVILKAANDTGVTDYRIVANLEKTHIVPRGILELTYDGNNAGALGSQLQGKDLNIVLVTAHSSEALRGMIYELGNAGAFRNNIVILMSCRTEVTRHLTEFIGGQGAKGVVVTDRVVPIAQATSILQSLLEQFDDPSSESHLFREIIFRAFDKLGGIISVSQRLEPRGRAAYG